jgi:ubiquitin carboxyl-terminal hydrolase 16
MDDWKLEGLQSGIVTKGLKEILDALNERPIYKKTITAAPFVRSLEAAFRQRISRQQQDAQEFLQVVAERLCDEYHAGCKARNHARRKVVTQLSGCETPAEHGGVDSVRDNLEAFALAETQQDVGSRPEEEEEEDGFPMEGTLESQIECLTCKFKPRPSESTFCTLTLNVPQMSSTTLNACFDGLFKTEVIDDFKCEKCRLVHAKEVLEADVRKSTSDSFKLKTVASINRLQEAIDTDPEKPPQDVVLPDIRYAPKRRIARHIRVTRFPKILAIHLSRSIYDSHVSQKNPAKVAFPERLPLGGLLHQKKYKLLGVVTHKGSHHSGHYESFRRQNVYPPFSNPNTFQPSGVYSASGSPASTPRISALQQRPGDSSPLASTPDLLSPAVPSPSPSSSSSSSPGDPQTPDRGPSPSITSLKHGQVPTAHEPSSSPSQRLAPISMAPEPREAETNSIRSLAMSARSTLSRMTSRPPSRTGSRGGAAADSPHGSTPSVATAASHEPAMTSTPAAPTNIIKPSSEPSKPGNKPKRRKHHNDHWWRISDEKVKEATTRDVLGMQREVYLLFYEVERAGS